MKKLLFICSIVILLSVGGKDSFASFNFDFMGQVSTEPITTLGTGIGGGIGVGIGLFDLGPGEIQLRGDATANAWVKTIGSTDQVVARIPLFIGARYKLDVIPVLKPFLDAGLELSFDFEESIVGSTKVSERFFRTGMGLGGGFYIELGAFSIGTYARYHVIKNEYFSFGGSIGFVI